MRKKAFQLSKMPPPFDYQVVQARRPDAHAISPAYLWKRKPRGKLGGAEREKTLQEFGAFTQSINSTGHYRGGNQLDTTSKATTVRVRVGKRVVTDGPFAETKEQLGGY
jgi:hypothetical protein